MKRDSQIKRLLFLTSTVTPKTGEYTGTLSRRRDEYINAVRFYLEHTGYPILIVDNSGYDFKQDFPGEERLEALCFDQPLDNRGKGYGEIGIIEYGFAHSRFIRRCNQIVKISGRYIFRNILAITSHFKNADAIYAEWNIQFKQVETWLMAGPEDFYKELIGDRESINDGEHFPIERLVAVIMDKWTRKGRATHSFLMPTDIDGHPGCAEFRYKRPTATKYLKLIIKYAACEIRNRLMAIRR